MLNHNEVEDESRGRMGLLQFPVLGIYGLSPKMGRSYYVSGEWKIRSAKTGFNGDSDKGQT